MSKDENAAKGCAVLFMALLIVSFALWASLWRASVQADVWQREGIEISTFEAWMGATPAERAIHLK